MAVGRDVVTTLGAPLGGRLHNRTARGYRVDHGDYARIGQHEVQRHETGARTEGLGITPPGLPPPAVLTSATPLLLIAIVSTIRDALIAALPRSENGAVGRVMVPVIPEELPVRVRTSVLSGGWKNTIPASVPIVAGLRLTRALPPIVILPYVPPVPG